MDYYHIIILIKLYYSKIILIKLSNFRQCFYRFSTILNNKHTQISCLFSC